MDTGLSVEFRYQRRMMMGMGIWPTDSFSLISTQYLFVRLSQVTLVLRPYNTHTCEVDWKTHIPVERNCSLIGGVELTRISHLKASCAASKWRGCCWW